MYARLVYRFTGSWVRLICCHDSQVNSCYQLIPFLLIHRVSKFEQVQGQVRQKAHTNMLNGQGHVD